LVNGAAPKTTDFHLRENGTVVPDSSVEVRPLQQTSNPVGTVLVIDTSGSMRSRGALDQAKAAAHQFIASRAGNEWTALVSVSSPTATEAQAAAALTGAHAAVFAVGIASDEFDPSRLASLVGGSGGSFSTSRDPVDLTAQFSRIRAAIENQYELLYTSTGPGGALSLDLSVGTLAAQVQTQAGSTGVAASPRPVPPARGPFSGASGRYL